MPAGVVQLWAALRSTRLVSTAPPSLTLLMPASSRALPLPAPGVITLMLLLRSVGRLSAVVVLTVTVVVDAGVSWLSCRALVSALLP